MASPTDTHHDVLYSEVEHPAQPGFVSRAVSDYDVEVRGACPACGGTTSTRFEWAVRPVRARPVRAGFPPRLAPPARLREGLRWLRQARERLRPQSAHQGRPATAPQGGPGVTTLFCECGHGHEGRPELAADHGCGAFWTVDLR